jgi:hypothetical protein
VCEAGLPPIVSSVRGASSSMEAPPGGPGDYDPVVYPDEPRNGRAEPQPSRWAAFESVHDL